MKKKLFIMCCSMLASVSMSADPITPAKALQLAQEFLVPGHAMSLVSEAKPRNAAAGANAPYYIISRGANQGFVVVSGDDCMPEILGYTEEGDFDENNVPDNFRAWMQHRANIIEYAQQNGLNTPRAKRAETMAKAETAGKVDVPYLLTSLWHQSGPYNDKCPMMSDRNERAMTGCVATAASQIVYYWRRDADNILKDDTPTYSYGLAPVTEQYIIKKGTPIKFDLMLDSYNNEPAEYKEAVATLVASLGMHARLTYGVDGGTATSGQIYDCINVFSRQFGLNGGTCVYKNDGGYSGNMSETAWANLLYNQLIQGRPVLYCGYSSGSGAHAVVCDGYQARTGFFHINFGWGSGWNGYFSVEDGVQGWGFNESWQGCVYDIYPKSWNMDVSMVPPTKVYANIENEFTIQIENHATLDFKGVYLFASTSATKPSSLSSAKSKDTEMVVPVDGKGVVTLTAKPTSTRTWYFTVTDEKLNVLAQVAVEPEEAESDLYLKGLAVAGSNDKEQFDGNDYQVVYNPSTTATATIYNASDIAYEGTQRMYFYGYDEETKEWTETGYKTGKVTLGGKETAQATFNINNTSSSCVFEVGKYYYGVLANPVPSSTDTIRYEEGTDTLVRFVLKDNDMELVSFEDNCLAIKGHFDATAFNSTQFAKKTAYKTATIYDLTQCTNVVSVSQEVNPNALYYVASDSEAKGVNIVKDGKCANLSLVPGYNFTPRAEFEAEEAQIVLGSEAAKWYLLTVPFTATVPTGMLAREITSHTTTGISNRTEDVKTLEAGKTYIIMSSSSANMTLTGKNTKVVTAPVENTDNAVVGTFTNTTTPADAQLLNDEETQYFVPMDEGAAVEALRGYWYASNLTKTFRAHSNITLDPAYLVLAQSVEQAYQILNQYKNVVTKAAYQAYLAEIQEAASEFSDRAETTLTSSTKIKNYAAQLLADGEEYKKQIANAGNMEIDFTDNIENPSFETKTTKGWTLGEKEGYTAVGSVYVGTAANNYRAVGLDGSYVFQSLIAAADSSSVSISQTVEGLARGYYRLTAMVGTDEHSTVTLFADDSTATVQGHAFGHLYLTKATIDNIPVENGTLTIGIKEGRWYKADNFTLTYVGSFPNDEEPDAIEDVMADKAPVKKGIYTIQGVQVNSITAPGIYIVDGKKYIVQ